jgi:hypothetical protein
MRHTTQVVIAVSIFALGYFTVTNAADGAPPESAAARGQYKSAAQGDPEAQAKLGQLYAKGFDVEQSHAAAFQWFMRAAGQGHSTAQLSLAEVWANGRGVPRSDVLAYRWALIAKNTSADPEIRQAAEKMVADIATRLSADQIADAYQRASEWKPDIEALQTIPPASAAPVAARKTQPKIAVKNPAARTTGSAHPPLRKVTTAPTGAANKRSLQSRLMQLARRLGL